MRSACRAPTISKSTMGPKRPAEDAKGKGKGGGKDAGAKKSKGVGGASKK